MDGDAGADPDEGAGEESGDGNGAPAGGWEAGGLRIECSTSHHTPGCGTLSPGHRWVARTGGRDRAAAIVGAPWRRTTQRRTVPGRRSPRPRSGDACAWSALYHDVAPILIGYLRAQRLPDPEDVAGEVLLEVVRDLGRFAGDARGSRSWVLAIAHHRLLDARRREASRPVTSMPAAEHAHRALDGPGMRSASASPTARVGVRHLDAHGVGRAVR